MTIRISVIFIIFISHTFKSRKTPDQEVAAVLKREGVDPDSIQTVILTHLHTDHAGCPAEPDGRHRHPRP